MPRSLSKPARSTAPARRVPARLRVGEFVVAGRLAARTREHYVIDSWAHADPTALYDEGDTNVKRFSIARAAVTRVARARLQDCP